MGREVEGDVENWLLDVVSGSAKKENFSIEELEEMRKTIDEAIASERS